MNAPAGAPGILQAVAEAFAASGIDLGALGLAWARVMPTVILVPAFGLRALPLPARAVLGLALAASIFPALAPAASATHALISLPWPLLFLSEIVRGFPIAIAAAVPLWAATMAGGMVDALRGASQGETTSSPVVEGRASALGVPLSLLASAIFLGTGGPARVVSALATREIGPHPLIAAAHDLTSGIALAVALGGPLLAASVVIEVASALIARAASPAHVHALLAPLRALGILAVMAIVLERFAGALAHAIQSGMR